ncbi:hypothetical protein AGDE_13453 [Angomonas deanei]|uniref:Uncharacterized protein n=1 Tax=Angomonas deanei TaxID=59799 RepID=A0A7G2CJB5_9TRYP|nr:hypothetical protein AGDE_13453 [Angomonas deanei]CAD2219948.1 hypothetical protein, conserved [Angomonas deanei]|eukprot:EPY22288.1 hypothetical protein AGDE_13453 [Angomonas deanei]
MHLCLKESEARARIIKEEGDRQNTLLSLFLKGSIGQWSVDLKKQRTQSETKINELNKTVYTLKGEVSTLHDQKLFEQAASKTAIGQLEAALSAQNQRIAQLLESIPQSLQEQIEKASSRNVSPQKEEDEVPLEERLRKALETIWKERDDSVQQKQTSTTEKELFAKHDMHTVETLLKTFSQTIVCAAECYNEYATNKSNYAKYEMDLIRLVEEKKASIKWQSMYEEKRDEVRYLEENVRLLRAEVKRYAEDGATEVNYDSIAKPFIPVSVMESKKSTVSLRPFEEQRKEALQLGAKEVTYSPVKTAAAPLSPFVHPDRRQSTTSVKSTVGSEKTAPKPQIKKVAPKKDLTASSSTDSTASDDSPAEKKKKAAAPSKVDTAPKTVVPEKTTQPEEPVKKTKPVLKLTSFDDSTSEDSEEETAKSKPQPAKEAPKTAPVRKGELSTSSSDSSLSLSITPAKKKAASPVKKVAAKKKKAVESDDSSLSIDSSSDSEATPAKRPARKSSFDMETPKEKNTKKAHRSSFDEETPQKKKAVAKKLDKFDDDTPSPKKVKKLSTAAPIEKKVEPKAEAKPVSKKEAPVAKGKLKLPTW